MRRRRFLSLSGTAALSFPLIGTAGSYIQKTEKGFKGHTFPELEYDFNALEPYVDAQTMELHYTKHHKGYFNNFISSIEGTELVNVPAERIFQNISTKSDTIRNNGGGFYNHALFWENMTPASAQKDAPFMLTQAIEKDFGSFEVFKEQFGKAAKNYFGSGWAWLAINKEGKLFVSSTANQDNPLMDLQEIRNGVPLLTLDVWEHAYYLKYQNRRAEYVDGFWNIVNWEVVNNRYKEAKLSL